MAHLDGNLQVGTGAFDSSGRLWWQSEIERRTAFAEAMGGDDKVERQHQHGRLTARERITALVDEGSWREIGMFTGKAEYDDEHRLVHVTPSNVITGLGRIGGRDVCVVAEDYTVRGGSSESTSPEKWQYAERLALTYRVPVIRLVEMAGGSINLLEQMSSTKIPGYPHWPFVEMLGKIPVIGVALGAAAGLGAVRVCSSHFSIMTAGKSWIFAGGPPVVKAGVGEDLTKEELGGSAVHARGSGVADNEAADELDAFAQVKQFLSYLPSSVWELPQPQPAEDPAERAEEDLATIIPPGKRQTYDMRSLLRMVFDRDSIFEIGRYNGRSIIAALARLDGHPVAVMANDPMQLGGALTAEASEKMVRFVELADTFHIPVVNFVDQPGTLVGSAAEKKGTVRKGIRAAMAVEQTTVPWMSIFVRRSFGLAGSSYAPMTSGALNWRYAWPSAYWGSIPVEGGVEAAYSRDIASSPDPAARREELVSRFHYLENPFLTAERFAVQDIIDPRTTRPILCEWIRLAYRLLPEHVGVHGRTMRC